MLLLSRILFCLFISSETLALQMQMSLEEVDNCTSLVDQIEMFVDGISQQIYKHTQKHFLIEELVIEVPHQKCLQGKPIQPRKTASHPEVRVGNFSHLTSLQYGPCGTRGHGVLFPSAQLKQSSNSSALILSEFTRLWMNHQEGVFMDSLQELEQPSQSSRHHLLCQGQSVKELLVNKYQSQPKSFTSPRVTYTVRPSRRAYVLAMQRSYPEFLMKNQSTDWETVQSSLLPLIYSLPADDQLAIITFDQESARLNLPPTTLNQDNRVLLHAAIPRRPALESNFSREACHHCSVSQLQKLDFGPETEVHVIWMVHSGKFDFADQLKKGKTAQYHHQVVGLDSNLDSSWGQLSSQTYVVGHCPDPVTCQGTLTRVLMETVGQSQNSYFTHQRLFSSVQGDLSTELELVPDVTDMVIVLTATNERDIAHLKSANQTHANYAIYSHRMAILHLSPADFKSGNKLLLEAKMYNRQDSFNLDIYGRKTGHQNSASAWVEVSNLHHYPQVVLYAASSRETRVTRVTAQIARPSHRGQELPWVSVSLQDTGTGYPDLSQHDNIYSAYFTQLSPEAGFYQVYVTIEYADEQTTHLLSTSFHVPQSNFYVRKEEGSRLLVNDVFPPNRITDLGVIPETSMNADLFVTLNWTAPGGDFDHGSAFRYEIRCATSQEALQENIYSQQSIPVHTSLIPEPEEAGTPQRCTVGVPWHNQMFYYAIVAIDASGNRGLISNAVSTSVSSSLSSSVSGNEIVDATTTVKPRAQPLFAQSKVAIWAPILAVGLVLLTVTTLFGLQRRFCRLQEYVCQDKVNDDNVENAASEINSSVTTSTAGVSASSSDEELSLDLSLDAKDSWSQVDLTPARVHIIEDYMVYRDLSTNKFPALANRQPDDPSVSASRLSNYDYWQLDQMLSALLSAKCKSNSMSQSNNHESLV